MINRIQKQKKKLNKQIGKSKNSKKVNKQDLALMGFHRALLRN